MLWVKTFVVQVLDFGGEGDRGSWGTLVELFHLIFGGLGIDY